LTSRAIVAGSTGSSRPLASVTRWGDDIGRAENHAKGTKRERHRACTFRTVSDLQEDRTVSDLQEDARPGLDTSARAGLPGHVDHLVAGPLGKVSSSCSCRSQDRSAIETLQ
jgi:hypothetical protein